jgi:hypothetical protein
VSVQNVQRWTMRQQLLHPEIALPSPFKLYIIFLTKIGSLHPSGATPDIEQHIEPIHMVAPYIAIASVILALCTPSIFCRVRKRKESIIFLISLFVMLVVYYALVVICTSVRPQCASHIAVLSAIHVLYTVSVRLQVELADDVVYMQPVVVSACTLSLVCLLYAASSLIPLAKVTDFELLVLLFLAETLGWTLKPMYKAVYWLLKTE